MNSISPYEIAKAKEKEEKQMADEEEKKRFCISKNVCPNCGKYLKVLEKPVYIKILGLFNSYRETRVLSSCNSCGFADDSEAGEIYEEVRRARGVAAYCAGR